MNELRQEERTLTIFGWMDKGLFKFSSGPSPAGGRCGEIEENLVGYLVDNRPTFFFN